MPRFSFTQNLQRHVECPDLAVDGATLREALEAVFERIPKLRGYILDDQGCVHNHVAIIVNGTSTTDRVRLSQALRSEDEVYIMQALSGG